MTDAIKQLEKDLTKPESKPEKLAKIMYAGIVRMIKAREARIGEKNRKLELDSDRKRRVNVPSRNFD
ncbi:MAG: hypothetical protein LBJ45_01725 [Holosporaceae bacterium]|jgi:hypothetical protein|nr:hypothetical protein [Holosporaceae bacterium]